MNQTKFIKWAEDSRGIPPKLTKAVIDQLSGWDDELPNTFRDITNHGIAGGFGGFIYYSDTVAFTKRHRAEILGLCESVREDIGEPDTLSAFIAGFSCLDMKPREVEAVLMDTGAIVRNNEHGNNALKVYNALAWFAGEEVARAYCDMEDEA